MQQSGQTTEPVVPTQRLWAFALMTIVGLATFAVALLSTEPHWFLWLCGGLMVASAAAFWISYAVLRWHQR